MKKLICIASLLLSLCALADSNSDMISYVQNGYEDDLAELLSHPDHDFDINFQDAEGNSALHLAVQAKNLAIMDVLFNAYPLSTGIKFNLKNNENATPFYLAVRSQNMDIVTKLLKANSHINLEDGPITPIAGAIIDENDSMAAFLIKSGASTVSSITYSNGTSSPILDFITSKDFPLTLTEFVKVNKDLNIRFAKKFTPLMNASYFYLLNNVKILAENGALLNLRDESGNSALHYAALQVGFYKRSGPGRNDDSVYEYLVAKGAKTDLKNLAGVTPEQIFQNHKGYFSNIAALRLKLVSLIAANPSQYNFSISSEGSFIHGLEFYKERTSTTLDLSQGFSVSSNTRDLTLMLLNEFVFKLSSVQELNELQDIINNIQRFAKTL